MSLSEKFLNKSLRELLEEHPEVVIPTVYVHERTKLSDVVSLLLSSEVELVVVTDNQGRPRGIIADHDILRLVEPGRRALFSLSSMRRRHFRYHPDLSAADVMERNPPTLHYSDRVRDLLDVITHHRVNYVIVVDDVGRPVGVVSSRHVTRGVLSRLREPEEASY
ncbi:MAG: hypothetical protein DRJ40_02405 [Thermoprotei archaeon]|nr:MAG: hypothetical protein DRJ40_02405 [Thermoprotei archaeon]